MAFWKRKDTIKETADPAGKSSGTANQPDPVWRSREFEKYVASLFSKQHFTVAIRSHDRAPKQGAEEEPGIEPSMKIQYKPAGEEFFVECRYWLKLGADRKLEWASERELKEYFRRSKQRPVFLVVGLGGRPASPATLFCMPLKEARWTELFAGVYKKFERPPSRMFFWRDGALI